MFGACQYRMPISRGTTNTFRRVLLVLRVLGRVTVLLFVITASGTVRADDAECANLRLFEFTSQFYMPMGMGRFDGLMASDCSQHRIAIYWVEPAVFRDHAYFLGCSDFIFSREQVRYWIYGMSERGTVNLADKESAPLLPMNVSVESVARSALAIMNRIISEHQDESGELAVGTFFHRSRDQANYSYEVPSKQTSGHEASDDRDSDAEILNALPYGRKYSKETRGDGAVLWRAQRVLDGPHVARVTVKPILDRGVDDTAGVFDADTLGQWMLVPEPYRAYWSFDKVYSKLKDEADSTVSSREFHDKIETYLAKSKVPDRIELAFNQLLLKTALLTGDADSLSPLQMPTWS